MLLHVRVDCAWVYGYGVDIIFVRLDDFLNETVLGAEDHGELRAAVQVRGIHLLIVDFLE